MARRRHPGSSTGTRERANRATCANPATSSGEAPWEAWVFDKNASTSTPTGGRRGGKKIRERFATYGRRERVARGCHR